VEREPFQQCIGLMRVFMSNRFLRGSVWQTLPVPESPIRRPCLYGSCGGSPGATRFAHAWIRNSVAAAHEVLESDLLMGS
jgi:hypothetical protein